MECEEANERYFGVIANSDLWWAARCDYFSDLIVQFLIWYGVRGLITVKHVSQ